MDGVGGWTCSQFIIAGKMIFSFFFWGEHLLPTGWSFLFTILWVFYTAFCIGVTVRVICQSIRAKREKERMELIGQ